jgi:DNA-3-methyladenine glycosylase II
MAFTLQPVAPFRLDFTALVLRRDPANAVDRWEPPEYRRVFVIDGAAVEAVVEQIGPPAEPLLGVRLRGPGAEHGAQQRVATLLRTVLGLDVDLAPFYLLAGRDQRLAPLAVHFTGLKPPVMPTIFEALLSGIACQQLSLVAGMHLLARLARAYGASLGGQRAFPRPRDLLRASPEDLRNLGFSLSKSKAILSLVGEVTAGRLDLEGLHRLGTPRALEFLDALPGVGPWTAQYVALRGLGRLDAFPVDDVGAQNKLQRLLKLGQRPGVDETQRLVDGWRPYQGLLYFHLLLDSLERGGAPPR